MLVCIERFDINGNFVFRAIDVLLRARVDVIALAGNAYGVAGNDLAARRIRNARLNAILEILIIVFARRVKGKHGLAGRVRFNRFALDDRTLTAVVAAASLFFKVVVVPGVIATRIPIVIERILINDDFD